MYRLKEQKSPFITELQKDLKKSIRQIEDALIVLDDERHEAAKICLSKSLEIIKVSFNDINR